MEELTADISFFMATVESGLNDTDGYKKRGASLSLVPR